MKQLVLRINMEPVAKARPRHWSKATKKGIISGTYTPDATAHAENIIRDKALKLCLKENIKFDKDEPLIIDFIIYRTKPKSTPKKVKFPVTRPDGENYQKLIQDALQGFVYHDDAQIIEWHGRKRWADDDHPPGIDIILLSGEE